MYRGSGEFMPTPDVALSVRVITRQRCEHIAKLAFEYAASHDRKKITMAHKDVVFSLSCGLFRDCVRAEAARYPAIVLEEELVDDLAGHLVRTPERFEMILTTNMFGDILADVAAAQVGGMVPVVNASDSTSFFCTYHAPYYDLAGRQQVNPLGMIRTLSAMLYWLKLGDAGRTLDRAVKKCGREPWSRVLQLPSGVTSSAVTQSIVQSILGTGK
jgi:3-isopropylmalate dehydrogenase